MQVIYGDSDLTNLPIPPLEPTWWQGMSVGDRYEPMPEALGKQVIFKLSLSDYMHRMELERAKLAHEAQLIEGLQQKNQKIAVLQERVKLLETSVPSIEVLREAYAQDVISQEELERMIMHTLHRTIQPT